MTLHELIVAVKEKNLQKDQLEEYRDSLSNVTAEMHLEMADLQKEEALYMGSKKDGQSVADRKVEWKATKSGQRLIELKNYASSAKILLRSLQNRLYNVY
jgi:hypothetical protein